MPKKRPATWFTAARPYLVYGALLAAGARGGLVLEPAEYRGLVH